MKRGDPGGLPPRQISVGGQLLMFYQSAMHIVGIVQVVECVLSCTDTQIASWLHSRHKLVDRTAEEVGCKHAALAHPGGS